MEIPTEPTQVLFQGVGGVKSLIPEDRPVEVIGSITTDPFGNGCYVTRAKDLSGSDNIQIKFTYVKNRVSALSSNPFFAAAMSAKYLKYKAEKEYLIATYGRENSAVAEILKSRTKLVKSRLQIPMVLNIDLTNFKRIYKDHWDLYVQDEFARATAARKNGDEYAPIPIGKESLLSNYLQVGAWKAYLGGGELYNANAEQFKVTVSVLPGDHIGDRTGRQVRVSLHIFSPGNKLFPDKIEENIDLDFEVWAGGNWNYAVSTDPKMKALVEKRILERHPKVDPKPQQATATGNGYALPDDLNKIIENPEIAFAPILEAILKRDNDAAESMLATVQVLLSTKTDGDYPARKNFIHYLNSKGKNPIKLDTPDAELFQAVRDVFGEVIAPSVNELLYLVFEGKSKKKEAAKALKEAQKHGLLPKEMLELQRVLGVALTEMHHNRPFQFKEGIDKVSELFEFICEQQKAWREKDLTIRLAVDKRKNNPKSPAKTKAEASIPETGSSVPETRKAPTVRTVLGMISACIHEGRVDDALEIVDAYRRTVRLKAAGPTLLRLIGNSGIVVDGHQEARQAFADALAREDGKENAQLIDDMMNYIAQHIAPGGE
ncbi:hypothetical protein ACTVZO_38930 [Streptomyces sp. IBSNAI002]|uniref:hypothetical protein n=1 Tax=Streptomyces sp. IBSNAI002 TaxID=3457500 RepID=UPI003FD56E66